MKWFRRRVRLTPVPRELQAWSYWCGDCGDVYRYQADTDLMAFVEQHKACHRDEQLEKDWS